MHAASDRFEHVRTAPDTTVNIDFDLAADCIGLISGTLASSPAASSTDRCATLRLHRVLVEQIPRVGRLENIHAIDHEAYALVRAYLEAHRDELGVADTDLAAFICVTTVEALTHAAVVQRPEVLSNDKAETFVDEVTLLVTRYLTT